MGINLWDNGSEQLALQSRPTGQWMKEDAITPLLPPNLRLRFLPTTKNHGRVAVQRFPYKHGLRCTNGHLIDAINPIGMEEHSALKAVRTPAQLVSTSYVPTATSIHLTTSVGSIMVRRVAIEMRN